MPTVFFCRRGTLLYCCISCKKYMTGGPTEPKLTSICPLVCLSLVYVLFISPSRACLVFAPHDIPNAHAPSQIQYTRIFSPPISFSPLFFFLIFTRFQSVTPCCFPSPSLFIMYLPTFSRRVQLGQVEFIRLYSLDNRVDRFRLI